MRVALITGSTSGIGLGIAEEFAKNGYNIVLHGLGDPGEITYTVQGLQKKYAVEVLYDATDLSILPACSTLVDNVIQKMGRLDILVNNAGIQYVSSVETLPIESWNKVLLLNLTVPFYLIQHALPVMREQNFGRIINIASVHGVIASKEKAAYVAAKHGLLGLTKVVALETATTTITCNAICPGWVLTPLVETQIQERAQKSGTSFEAEKNKLLWEKQPSGEFVKPQDIGQLAVFLCSEGGNQVRGATWLMDGGWTIQ